LQLWTVHAPLTQPGVALGTTQASLQPPQLFTSLEGEISQPLLGSLSQFSKPESQLEISHTPLPQVAVACVRLHAVQDEGSQPNAGSLSLTQLPLHDFSPFGQI
jgi:hypothetical protein